MKMAMRMITAELAAKMTEFALLFRLTLTDFAP